MFLITNLIAIMPIVSSKRNNNVFSGEGRDNQTQALPQQIWKIG